jgi:hypothetical protein
MSGGVHFVCVSLPAGHQQHVPQACLLCCVLHTQGPRILQRLVRRYVTFMTLVDIGVCKARGAYGMLCTSATAVDAVLYITAHG